MFYCNGLDDTVGEFDEFRFEATGFGCCTFETVDEKSGIDIFETITRPVYQFTDFFEEVLSDWCFD